MAKLATPVERMAIIKIRAEKFASLEAKFKNLTRKETEVEDQRVRG